MSSFLPRDLSGRWLALPAALLSACSCLVSPETAPIRCDRPGVCPSGMVCTDGVCHLEILVEAGDLGGGDGDDGPVDADEPEAPCMPREICDGLLRDEDCNGLADVDGCASGTSCLEGSCQVCCCASAACPASACYNVGGTPRCTSELCPAMSCAGLRALGADCASDDECASGKCWDLIAWRQCGSSCCRDTDCTDTWLPSCDFVTLANGRVVNGCTPFRTTAACCSAADCPPSERCAAIGGAGGTSAMRCQSWAGALGAGAACDPAASISPCTSGYCLRHVDGTGECVASCCDDRDCPAGGGCHAAPMGTVTVRVCLP